MLHLAQSSRSELDRLFLRGTTPDPNQLSGWQFRGVNTQFRLTRSSGWARFFGLAKFIKGFFRDPEGQLFGYNVVTEQDALTLPWLTAGGAAGERRFAFFRVVPVDPEARDNRYLHALLLDYGQAEHPLWDPSRGLRDYLVQVDPRSPDLFLGRAFFALGPARIETNFFLLERHRAVDDT